MFPQNSSNGFISPNTQFFVPIPNNSLAIPVASKKFSTSSPFQSLFQTPPPKPKKSDLLITSELELMQIIGIERSNLSKKIETLFNGKSSDIVPCLLKPQVNISFHNYDPNLNYKDMCDSLKNNVSQHLSFLKQRCLDLNFLEDNLDQYKQNNDNSILSEKKIRRRRPDLE